MNAIETLISVLCGPEGKCCISGSDDDRRLIDSALAELAKAARADSVPAVSDLPPLPAPDLRDVGTKPQEIKEFLKGYATEYARTAIAARAQAGAAEPVAWAFKYDDGTWHDPSTAEHSSGMRPLLAAPQPVARETLTDWDMRGQLAASLHCWHRLAPNEAAELVAFVQRVSAHGIKGGQHG